MPPIRAWRDDLTLIRDSLSYARAILAADVAILSDSGLTGGAAGQRRRRRAPRHASRRARARTSGRMPEDLEDLDLAIDEDLFVRTDQLLAAHREMARVDRPRRPPRPAPLAQVEEQLAILTERQAAVEARLQQIRAAILRRYQQEAAPARDQPA